MPWAANCSKSNARQKAKVKRQKWSTPTSLLPLLPFAFCLLPCVAAPHPTLPKEKRMPAITSTNVAQAIVKLVAADALPALVGNLVMGNLVNRNYEPVLAQAGDTVNVPIAPQLVANNIAEGFAVQLQNPSLGNA